ncbi:diphosphate--fructose-6-phosphate 1-phosphotransferase [Candidatus Similichlamydia epinepheli]|uniref:diphosphate--fructose-6-phosphate 1-phosphotransferase n=1 Tax=Candidatus Similichlamydia epinepheli TaxID=1903953 RepID=UPI000D37A9B2|nr:diphosphate--fructose-6-phosphate 1-phosphotransferase [Candidatus Similichlamydia epinepheli]
MFANYSGDFSIVRANSPIQLPKQLSDFPFVRFKEEKGVPVRPELEEYFPSMQSSPLLIAEKDSSCTEMSEMRIGVLFSGGPAPGGHNVLLGISDAISRIGSNGTLFGFQDGFKGLLEGKNIELTNGLLKDWANSGGFHLLSTSRQKLKGNGDFEKVAQVCTRLELDGLVVIGGDDSNTNAGLLAEFFQKEKLKTSIVGVPKTIDGDLKGHSIEVSFGHDTAAKVISELVGNVCLDSLSCKKNYHFVRLMGRHASHLTLEAALQVQPTYALISEQIKKEGISIQRIVSSLVEIVKKRAAQGKHYGVILIPEGLIEQIPGIDTLICVLNDLLARDPNHTLETIHQSLDPASSIILGSLPKSIQVQLLYDRDAHGNVAVSRIETERLLLSLVKQEVEKISQLRKTFSAIPHFFGYECRCAHPSLFDAHYCYSLGMCAAALVREKRNGYMALMTGLEKDIYSWQVRGVPLISMFQKERREGKWLPVIRKTLVDLNGPAFLMLKKNEELWSTQDCFLSPGPYQFEGERKVSHSIPRALFLEKQGCGD